jgi:hypothetical protein
MTNQSEDDFEEPAVSMPDDGEFVEAKTSDKTAAATLEEDDEQTPPGKSKQRLSGL